MRWGTKATPERASKAKVADDAPWTDADMAELKALRSEDQSARLIAGKINRTVKSVEAKIAELRTIRR